MVGYIIPVERISDILSSFQELKNKYKIEAKIENNRIIIRYPSPNTGEFVEHFSFKTINGYEHFLKNFKIIRNNIENPAK